MSELEEALAAGRSAAAELMRETVTVYRPGPDVFDRETGQTLPGLPEVVFYTGPARVKPLSASDTDAQAGEREVVLRQYTVSVPFSTAPPESGDRLRPGDLVDVSASPDPRLGGLRLWVTGVQYGSTATAWRIIAEDRS
ncbi:DUF6093 family protein [Streptomyces sp. NPDC126499]|uniref:DUF6093 family protein n=1 Tax=Streptomyces sp. NPDC126499 TaxID=3155314 RepID=UPI00332D0D2E